MRASPIQTESIVYGEISVAPQFTEESEPVQAEGFDWDGVNLEIGVKYDTFEDEGRLTFPLLLRIQVPNREGSKKKAPYTITISVMGRFAYTGEHSKDEALDLVVVNGLSILYSSLREMIITITSRMLHGSLYLPGANFMDHAPSKQPRKPAKVSKTVKRKADAK